MQLLFRALKNLALQVHVAKDNSILGDVISNLPLSWIHFRDSFDSKNMTSLPYSRLECKTRTLFEPKVAKINTLFMT